jgi:DNA-binding CsgD family transcriptional regulator
MRISIVAQLIPGKGSRGIFECEDPAISESRSAAFPCSWSTRNDGEGLAKDVLLTEHAGLLEVGREKEQNMLDLYQIKITRRDQQVLRLLVQGCSNKEIAAELSISPRTVKQHLRTLFLRAGIKQGRKRVILATAIFAREQMNHVAF